MLQLLFSGRGRLITHLTGWALVTLATYYLLLGMMPAGEAFARTVLFICFPIILFYTNARILTNRFFEAQKYGQWAVLAVLLWLGMAYLRVQTELAVFGSTVFSNKELPVDGGRNVFMVTVVIYFVLMIFSGLYQLLENRRDLDARHAEAQLSYLKAQINPHFLFNTLNNIYAAATLQHPRTADMVLRLSDLLRYVTYEGQAQRVLIDKEITQIRAYIELFQWKSEHALPITFSVEGDTTGHQIEPLLLLPLVENALKHGDLETSPEGFLRISLLCSSKKLVFTVENSYDPENTQKDEQGGVGLENVRKRLSLGYAGNHQLETHSNNKVFRAQISLNV